MLSDVPKGWVSLPFKAVLKRSKKSINANQLKSIGTVAHYSLPAFDAGKQPVIESGSEIKSGKTLIPSNCLLFSKLNPRIPRVWRVLHKSEHPPVCSTEFWAFEPVDRSVDLDFVASYLGWQSFLNAPEIKPASSTNSHQRINGAAFDNYLLNLPPLTEQQRIAEVLSSVDKSIQATQRLIEQGERVKQGLMEELLTGGLGSEAIERGEVPEGWRLANLKDCTSKIGSGVTPKGGKKAYVEAGIPIIRSQNVGWGSALLTDVAHITEQQHDKMANSKLMHEDVLLNITGASIGRCAVYKGANFQANVNQHVCILRTRENLHPSYLCAWLLSHTGQRQIDKFQAGGNRQGLNFQQIGSFSLPLPTISEQVSIAAKLDDVSVLLKKQKELISQKLTVKKGLMDDLLTGKVRTV